MIGYVLGLLFLGAMAAGLLWLGRQLHRRQVGRWLVPYVLQTAKRRPPAPAEDVHLLLCIADHYEPNLYDAPPALARARVRKWVEQYPRLFGGFRDSDGRPPRHTFFFPLEVYEAEHLDALAELCRHGFGEVEVHLHHDHDTADNLRRRLLEFKTVLSEQHGLLARDKRTGEVGYAFIHGNWALDNARPDGRWCGINNELDVLRETGCYVDMTLPSAPSPTQTRTINSIYYATDDPARPKSHDTGVPVGRGPQPPNSLMLIQGPLLLDWGNRKWGLLPRIENACLQGSQPPSLERLRLWLKARVQVPTRPDWFFVKLHTHGANEANQGVLLGANGRVPPGAGPRQPPLSLPLRDGPRDVQLGQGRRGRLDGRRGRGPRLPPGVAEPEPGRRAGGGRLNRAATVREQEQINRSLV
jgi:hypothetical protein